VSKVFVVDETVEFGGSISLDGVCVCVCLCVSDIEYEERERTEQNN